MRPCPCDMSFWKQKRTRAKGHDVKQSKANSDLAKCPVTYGLDIFGDRWSLLIIRDIVFRGKRHYSEFARSDEKISTNILANRLARLEGEGILLRKPDPENGAKFLYILTRKGQALIPIVLEIIIWSAQYDTQDAPEEGTLLGAFPDLLARAQNDRHKLVRELRQALPR